MFLNLVQKRSPTLNRVHNRKGENRERGKTTLLNKPLFYMKNEIDAEWKNNQTGLRQSWERKQERRERGKERKAKLIV